jgi:O-antigen/teichoic acid export membrane protein
VSAAPPQPRATPAGPGAWRDLPARLRAHWGDRHYRNGYYLMLNSITGAAAGLLFWLVLVRLYAVSDRDIGIGLAVISLSTAFALVAKGGLDAAIVRHVPRATRAEGLRLLELAITAGFIGVSIMVLLLASLPGVFGIPIEGLTPPAFAMFGVLGALLVLTWLQDAHFLAEGEARFSFYRNLVLHTARLGTPALILALALPYPIPLAWGLALGLSAIVAFVLLPRLPDHRAGEASTTGATHTHAERIPPRHFLRTAAHNIAGSAAEFLPGLLLAPLVLHLEGPETAAYFGIAWTGASMLFLLSASIARSTFAEMSRHGDHARFLRRALQHHALIVAPAALAAMALSPILLGLFGPGYATHGQGVFLLLAGSVVLLVPIYLYLALLRSRDAQVPLVVFPAVLIVVLFALAPTLERSHGLVGVGLAWVLAHAPLAAFAALRLLQELRRSPQEVTHAHAEPPAPTHGGAPHME